jgi:pentatricopeptide repeat protein
LRLAMMTVADDDGDNGGGGGQDALLATTAILVETYSNLGLADRAIQTLDRIVSEAATTMVHASFHASDNDDKEPLTATAVWSSTTAKDHVRTMVTQCLRALAKNTTAVGATTPTAERLLQVLIDGNIPLGHDTTRWYLKCLLLDRRDHPIRSTQYAHERLLVLDWTRPASLDLSAYGMMLDRWCRWGYPAHAETWLRRILARQHLPIRTDHFTQVLSSWTRLIDRSTSRDEAVLRIDQLFDLLRAREQIVPADVVPVKPTRAICEMCISALALSRCSLAPESMQKIFMCASDDPSIGIDVVMFHQVIAAWHRSSREDAVEHMEPLVRFVQRRHHRLLNTYSYNTIMSVYAKHDRPDKGLEIFEQFLESPRRSKVRPSFRSYMILIDAFSAAEEPDKATAILAKLTETSKKKGFYLMPCARKSYTDVFNEMLGCWLWNHPDRCTANMLFVIRCMAHLSKSHDVSPDDLSLAFAWSSLQFCGPDELGQLTLDVYNTSVELGVISVSQLREHVESLSAVLHQGGHAHIYAALLRQADNGQPRIVTTVPREVEEVVPKQKSRFRIKKGERSAQNFGPGKENHQFC